MKRKILAGIGLAVGIGILSISTGLARPVLYQTVTFINVGQGDAALIQDGSGFDVLIDGGNPHAGPTVVAYLHAAGVTELDELVASHADSDHIGGLTDVLQDESIQVLEVIYNGYPGETAAWEAFAAAADARGLALHPVQFPAALTWGSMRAYVLNPAAGLINPETNDASLVLRLDYGDTRMLFTGDIDATIEATVVARQTPIASDVLKVAHHGSASSSGSAFLAAVRPQAAVISVGVNSYGHPSEQVLARLAAAGSLTGRTDRFGDIRVSSDGVSLSVSPDLASRPVLFLPLVLTAGSQP